MSPFVRIFTVEFLWNWHTYEYTSSQESRSLPDLHIGEDSLTLVIDRLNDLPASILRGESGSGDSSSALTAVQAVDIVQAGLH